MMTTPLVTALASPEVLTEATAASEELHPTELVISWLVPSEKFPVAVNCCVAPTPRLVFAGDTTTAVRVGVDPELLTLSVALACVPPEMAMIVAAPSLTALAIPEALTDATPEFDELHCTEPVTSWLLPSENFPVAVNCCPPPGAAVALAGDTCKLVSDGVGGVTVPLDPELLDPNCPPPLQAVNKIREIIITISDIVFTLFSV
jgi:hypothetical protein